MSAPQLDPSSTDAGAMERLFLLETADPSKSYYNRADSLKAMRWMKQVIDNRLAAPRKSRFGEPADAKTETDIIAVGSQFAGFGDYPRLSADFEAKLGMLARLAAAPNDPRAARYAGFVADAIGTALERVHQQSGRPSPRAQCRRLFQFDRTGLDRR